MAHVGEEQMLAAGTSTTTPETSTEERALDCETRLPWRDLIKQILVACTIQSVVIQAGINLSFSAVLLPQLAAEYNASTHANATIHIDRDAASWIASLVTISLPLGALIVGSLMDKFGRKRVAIATTLPFTIAWLMHYWAPNVDVIYAARIVAGFGSGLSTVCLIYVAELSHPSVRAMLLSLNSVFVCLGILLTCAVGGILHWRTMSLCYALLSLSSCLSLLMLPESPHWLHSFENQTSRATMILSWLYSSEAVYQLEERRLWDNQMRPQRRTLRDVLASFARPVVRRPLGVLLALFLLQQLTGCYAIVFYAVDVFRLVGRGVDAYGALVLLGAVRFGAALVASATSARVERKALLVVSAAGMLVAALLAASSVGALATWCVVGYVAAGGVGVLVVPWTLVGELLPLEARGQLGGLLCAFAYALMFGLVKGFPYLVAAVDVRRLFYCLVGVNGALVWFVVARLPETFGKSFHQIEQHFAS